MNRLSRRTVLAGTIAAAGTAVADDRPLRIVVGFPPGAGLDTTARLLADKLRLSLGRTVVVENKPGAGGMIANTTVKAAPPDGSTLLMTPLATMVFYPHTYARLEYDSFKDYVLVAYLAALPLALGVGPEVPAKMLSQYVAFAKKGGTSANFPAASLGSQPHFFGLLFAKTAGIELTYIPYKGTAQALFALMLGEIPAAILPLSDLGAVMQSGKA